MVVDWEELVKKPQEAGYYVEAFGAADALIDFIIFDLVERFYISHEVHGALGLLETLEKRRKLEASTLLAILVSENVVSKEMIARVEKYKEARNLVLHDKYAEYALVIYNDNIKFSNDDEMDNAAIKEADLQLDNAEKLFYEIKATPTK